MWSGVIEIHITADMAFGAWQYYKCINIDRRKTSWYYLRAIHLIVGFPTHQA